jgi:tRNA(fMet)-specific endonuclease VapC
VAVRLAIDTNRYRDLCDGKSDVVERLETAEAVFVPFVVLAELRAGFAVGKRGRANERILHQFLAQPGVTVLHSTDATTRSYAALYRQLRTQGTPMPANDLWIAALVLEHDLALYTRDAHFEALPQLNVV